MKLRTVLSTRKIDPHLITTAAKELIEIKEVEFITIRPKEDEQTKFQVNNLVTEVVVFTSKNAVRAVASLLDEYNPLKWQRMYCIEGSTSGMVEKLWGNSCTGTAADAASLAELIAKKENSGEVTFFCGDRRRDELPLGLSNAGIAVNEIQVYETITAPVTVNFNYDGIMFFSPSAVQSFFAKNAPEENVVCFSIGSTTSNELEKHTNNRIVTAKQPSESCLLQLVVDYTRSNI